MFESQIAAGVTEKLLYSEKTWRKHFFVFLWYGRFGKAMPGKTLRICEQNNSTITQSRNTMHWQPPIQERWKLDVFGELSNTCSQIVLKCLYLARIGRPDILWSVNKLARAITKWTKAYDKRLCRLISYIHHPCEYKQFCHVGNTAKQCRLGLFQDSVGLMRTTRHSNCGTSAAILVWWVLHQDCVMRSTKLGWTVVIRKSRNRQQGSRRRGCSDKRGMVLGSLWGDDNDMILEQVADDRTKKGMVKISAVVDSGAEANALPENLMQCIPLKPSSASKSGKIFRGAGEGPILAQSESRWLAERMRDKAAGSSGKFAQWSVLSWALPKSQSLEIKSTWARTRPLPRTTRQGKSQTSVESATCGCSTCG